MSSAVPFPSASRAVNDGYAKRSLSYQCSKGLRPFKHLGCPKARGLDIFRPCNRNSLCVFRTRMQELNLRPCDSKPHALPLIYFAEPTATRCPSCCHAFWACQYNTSPPFRRHYSGAFQDDVTALYQGSLSSILGIARPTTLHAAGRPRLSASNLPTTLGSQLSSGWHAQARLRAASRIPAHRVGTAYPRQARTGARMSSIAPLLVKLTDLGLHGRTITGGGA